MKNITIKVKLVLLFILIKIVPLLLIAYIAYEGVLKIDEYLTKSTNYLYNQSKEIIINTANASIEDSIKNLDKKSQESLEKVSYEIANQVANFLYERDKDILFLSKSELNENVLKNFFESKKRNITVHDEYYYDENSNSYKTNEELNVDSRDKKMATLKDNEKEFNYVDPIKYKTKELPIYKEISFVDLKGFEKYKVSTINENKLDVSNKKNTFASSEDYFSKIDKLKKGDIYVSDVIGEYVGTRVIGAFTKEKAAKAGIEFEPQKYGYAGLENPLGKRFDGIVRFVTPVFNSQNEKIGYVSMALDHKHVREFTDTANPTGKNVKQNIPDASLGNYAFMWDYEGKNISHPRDYSIVGYDKNTGLKAMPWLSADIAEKYYASNQNINEFLKNYPIFEEQSLIKKPNLKQLKEQSSVGLDCRYLNFAPQCEGWMQVTQNGGYGSFVINWSGVWKLTTAATIPYYTGQYANSKRGFGFVTIGASVDDFHAAANETKKNVSEILKEQTKSMEEIVTQNQSEIEKFIKALINELSIVTFIMVILIIFIAMWMSNYILSKINKLLTGTNKFASKEFDYRIDVTSDDEIGNLEKSFNNMASEINTLIQAQKELNDHLEVKVSEKTTELLQINQNLEKEIDKRTLSLKDALLKAQNADKAKSTFLGNMSHEIRTPLNSIIGFAQIINTSNDSDETSKKYSQIIDTSAKALLAILNDVLDISKIQSGTFEIKIEKANVKTVCEKVFNLYSTRANEKNVDFTLDIDNDIPSSLFVDKDRIKQVLSNLVSNAMKFTKENGKVNMTASLLSKNDNMAKIRFLVSDTGIGIEHDKIKDIFEPFVQADNEVNRNYEGTGLGLSICSYIVKSLNSFIEIKTRVGRGSTFWFDLELECANEEIGLVDESEQNDDTQINSVEYKGKVLVLENNSLNQEVIRYLLQTLCIDCEFVESRVELLDKYKTSDYDLILFDTNIEANVASDIYNYEKENYLMHIPLIALSANEFDKEKDELSLFGVKQYLKKPIDINQLKRVFDIYMPSHEESIEEEQINDSVDEIKYSYNKQDAIDSLCLEESIVDMLLDSFFLTLDSDIKNIQDAINSKSAKDIALTSHYLKGACANLAMNDAVKILQDMEQKAKNGEVDFDLKELNRFFEQIR